MADGLPRHTMVRPSPAAWAALMAVRSDLAAEPLIAEWADAGRPLVVRRSVHGDAAGTIPLGLPSPPAHGKRRIAVSLARDDVLGVRPPPLLAEAAHAAPARWRDCIDACLRLDPRTRVYGSLAWQHLTGLPYLSDTSDLDLLWQLPPASDVDALLAGIATIAREAPMRIDGEVVGAAGGVQWRELLGDRVDDVLVKASSGILPMSRLEFLAGGAA